jgi:hypothetical protein
MRTPKVEAYLRHHENRAACNFFVLCLSLVVIVTGCASSSDTGGPESQASEDAAGHGSDATDIQDGSNEDVVEEDAHKAKDASLNCDTCEGTWQACQVHGQVQLITQPIGCVDGCIAYFGICESGQVCVEFEDGGMFAECRKNADNGA